MRQLVEIRIRRDQESDWNLKNPILESGEQGFETDTGKFKIGNGVNRWLDLRYFIPDDGLPIGGSEGLAAHIIDPTPHTAYDEGPSLLLLYLNAKV